jgi:hypothetical protein
MVCALLIAGCGGGGGEHAIDTSKYSRACASDSDCVAVYQGTLGCCGGGCPNTAIAVTSYADYAGAVASQTPVCNPAPPCAATPGTCGDQAALCVGAMCTLAMMSAGAISGGSP